MNGRHIDVEQGRSCTFKLRELKELGGASERNIWLGRFSSFEVRMLTMDGNGGRGHDRIILGSRFRQDIWSELILLIE